MVTRSTPRGQIAPTLSAPAMVAAGSCSSRSGPMRVRHPVIEEWSSGRACWKCASPQNA